MATHVTHHVHVLMQGQIEYRLEGFQPGTTYFSLDQNSGAIIVRRSLIANTDVFASYTVSIFLFFFFFFFFFFFDRLCSAVPPKTLRCLFDTNLIYMLNSAP